MICCKNVVILERLVYNEQIRGENKRRKKNE